MTILADVQHSTATVQRLREAENRARRDLQEAQILAQGPGELVTRIVGAMRYQAHIEYQTASVPTIPRAKAPPVPAQPKSPLTTITNLDIAQEPYALEPARLLTTYRPPGNSPITRSLPNTPGSSPRVVQQD